MLLIAAVALAVLLVPVLGGRLSALGGLRLQLGGLLTAALALQVLALVVLPQGPRLLLVTMHGASYLLAGYVLWRNRAVPGLLVLGLGGLSNGLGLALNNGTLPASARALRQVGLPAVTSGYSNSGVLLHPHAAWLGDVFAAPAWLPLRNVYSVGDLLVLVGAAWVVHRTCRSALARDPRPGLGARRQARQPVAAGVLAASQPGRASAGIGRLSR